MLAVLLFASSPAALAADPPAPGTTNAPVAAAATVIHDAAAAEKLLGDHALALQWIGWEQLGKATVTVDAAGVYHLVGEQTGAGDSLRIDGTVRTIEPTTFTFDGTITTQVSYIAGGQPCTRSGPFTFAIKGRRHYWRLVEMNNPCEAVVDYVDVFLR